MKKLIVMSMALLFTAVSAVFAAPQDNTQAGAEAQAGGRGLPPGFPPASHRGGPGDPGQMGMVQAKMMNSMMIRPVGVSQNGDVFILAGTKLQKYDTNLTLVKEQEIQTDFFAPPQGQP